MTNSSRRFKNAIYEQFAGLAKALANPRRLELLNLLAQGPRTVESLAEQANMSLANTSQHLQRLRGTRLVTSEKSGLFVSYCLANEQVGEVIFALQELARSRLAEVERLKHEFFSSYESLEALNKETLLDRVRQGEVVIVDVRPAQEYQAGHITGALSLPIDELEYRIDELPCDQTIVAYCRGPYCVFSAKAVQILRARGFTAARLEEGPLEWKASFLPVERKRISP